jgi:Uma2 family endonuclease
MGQKVFEQAPEICVEVLSPSQADAEMQRKKQLYFEAGAEEVWFCREDGRLEFYEASQPNVPQTSSQRCPAFPSRI